MIEYPASIPVFPNGYDQGKILDAAGIRVGGILSDLFGTNGMRILTGLVEGQSRERILGSLSHHVRPRLAQLHDVLDGKLDDCDHFVRRVSADFIAMHGRPLYLLETFVDPRFAGTCYRAAGWQDCGWTAGKTRNGRPGLEVPRKRVLVRPLRRDARAWLCC